MNRQIRITDTHFGELNDLVSDLGLSKSEVLGVALSILRALRAGRATSIKIVSAEKETEMILPINMARPVIT